MDAHPRRHIRAQTYGFFLLLFAVLLVCSHLSFLALPYYWDEAGYYVPAALDLYHSGALLPYSVAPNAHPPGLMAYLAAAWSIAGYHPAVTRSAMLLVATFGLLAAFLLAIELSRESSGAPAFVAVTLLACSPLFFAQSMMAQLDMPAMVLTTVALLLFIQDRVPLSAAVCVALVLVKETGVVAPLVFFLWLAKERRWRDAVWFVLPAGALSAWLLLLWIKTGHPLGSSGFAQYNLWYPLAPSRVAVNLLRRLYTLAIANFHWIGTLAIVLAWRSSRIYRSRAWRVAWWLFGAQTLVVTLLGGAVLERYLLPVFPILYAAMAAALSLYRGVPRIVCSAALAAGMLACIFVNPPYPFPYEDNIAFTDFVHLQADATDYLEHWYSGARITAIWPMTLELAHPELGYVHRPIDYVRLANSAPDELRKLDWSKVQVLVVFSKNWDPDYSLMRLAPVQALWKRFYGFVPSSTENQARASVPLPMVQRFERRGQWAEIYAAPDTPVKPYIGTPSQRVSLPGGHALAARLAQSR
ncbi:MAG TPA: hypothetical protein VN736_18475 [Candidatus Limnocylindrales bacterium]|nr:hypothetical protein [Candidatus Limnocylindrales bacterium]